MNTLADRQRLLKHFQKSGYTLAAQQGEFHKFRYRVQTWPSGGALYIVYPGVKADWANGRYDYRIDLKRGKDLVTLSHANILVDLYHKGWHEPRLIPELRIFLMNLAAEGDRDPYANTRLLVDYSPQAPPSSGLLQRIQQAHHCLNQPFNIHGSRWDLTIPELIAVIHWITLKEDWPQEENSTPPPHCQGRQIAFDRYLEALHCAENPQHPLEEVILRALSRHHRPIPWRGVDYEIFCAG